MGSHSNVNLDNALPPDSHLASSPHSELDRPTRVRKGSTTSNLSRHLRRASSTFEESSIPAGFVAATSVLASTILPVSPNQRRSTAELPPESSTQRTVSSRQESDIRYENGYHFPPSRPFAQSFQNGLVAFWHYFLTPLGFFVVLYGLLVVAWGGMLFLLLCNAAPAMCHPTCNDINSPRRKWIEYDSQIINALFCVTGFGLAPWRFRDLYFLLRYRVRRSTISLRKLGAIHRGWLRLPGSERLPIELGPETAQETGANNVPYPARSIPDPPRTGIRAPATPLWKLDFVVWMMVGNTFLQCVLCGFMWGYSRYDRPSWAVGLFVALACIVASLGGLVMFLEGRKVKAVEGVPVTDEDLELLARDRELGIPHYNNFKDKKPKQ